MRKELTEFRNLCKKNNVNHNNAKEFFRNCFMGKWDTNTIVNDTICYAMKNDKQAIKECINQNS